MPSYVHLLRTCAVAASLLGFIFDAAADQTNRSRYAWLGPDNASASTLQERIPAPDGFVRVFAGAGSWAEWLRNLPLKTADSPVLLYTGAPKWRQDAHVAVLDIDVGERDLQQCADAIMRLRAEWLFATRRASEIAFNHTDGRRLAFKNRSDRSYTALRKYMTQVFAYAGSYSLQQELKPVPPDAMEIGDVFIKGGFPGHAILVADMVVNPHGAKKFLLLQSYMPAQDMHILVNPADPAKGPWYDIEFGETLVTPEWTFAATGLRRWP